MKRVIFCKSQKPASGQSKEWPMFLADRYLSLQFNSEDRAEIKKIIDGFSFLAQRRLLNFKLSLYAKYCVDYNNNTIGDEINKLHFGPIKAVTDGDDAQRNLDRPTVNSLLT